MSELLVTKVHASLLLIYVLTVFVLGFHQTTLQLAFMSPYGIFSDSFWLSFFLMTLTDWRPTDQEFCSLFPSWVCLMFFLMFTQELGVLGRKVSYDKVLFSLYLVKSTYCPCDSLTVLLGWGVFAVFLYYKVSLFFSPSFPTMHFRRESVCTDHV